MHYDVVIIGAGMSGLAAGIRCAMFDQRVCIVEKHYAYGGLNSYYTLGGRRFDVGLHALTNYAPPGVHAGPLPKVLRQLRIRREELELCPQIGSEVRFPGRRLRFTNDLDVLIAEVAREFPSESGNFTRFLDQIRKIEYGALDETPLSTRAVLNDVFKDPLLIEMLLCPVMYYGSPSEHDMEFCDFAVIFKSIYCEGFARPREGVVGVIKPLVRKFRSSGGKLRMRSGVERIIANGNRIKGVTLETGEQLTCDTLMSSAGYLETMRLCEGHGVRTQPGDPLPGPLPERERGLLALRHARDTRADAHNATRADTHDAHNATRAVERRLSFVESFLVLDRPPAELGMNQTVIFFNDADRFRYAAPDAPVDLHSGVICCPNNYEDHGHLSEGVFRLTWLANYDRWACLDAERYDALKREYLEHALERAAEHIPTVRDHVVFTDMFTPRTIEAFTGHVGGAVYGSPNKCRDGRTSFENLYLCGSDQGLVGIIGALMSGVTMANVHVLSEA